VRALSSPAMRARILSLAASLVLAAPAAAQDVEVDLELVLAVDVSWSMDLEEQVFQRAGYVAAFRDPAVIAAIGGGGLGRIAVTYVEWGGATFQEVVLPWTLIDGAASAEAFAERLSAGTAGRLRRTSISGALAYSRDLFEGNGFEGARRVVDVSGDGVNNQGPPVTGVRDALVAENITINGLPIMIKTDGPGAVFSIPDLDIYFADCVIGGPSAFYITVTEIDGFAAAIRRKLILEIAGRTPESERAEGEAQVIPAQLRLEPPAPRVDCLVGEKIWQRRQWYYEDR